MYSQLHSTVVSVLSKYNMHQMLEPYTESLVRQMFQDNQVLVAALNTIDDVKAEFSKRAGFPISLVLYAEDVQVLFDTFTRAKKHFA